jgi:thioredoxin-like negative regulator of GroEL
MLHLEYFFSPTCSICDTQKLVLKSLNQNTNITYSNYNIFSDMDKALQRGVKSAPTLAIVADNKTLALLTGFQDEHKLLEHIRHWENILSA